MSNPPDTNLLTSAELRARAARCLQRAAKVPRGLEAQTLKTFGREYLKMAARLEELDDALPTPRRPGRA